MEPINLGKVQGPAGENGLTPHIGANGNWWVGEEDTGVKAQGPQGDMGQKLYDTAGQATDGSMTQKAATDAINAAVQKTGDTMTGDLKIGHGNNLVLQAGSDVPSDSGDVIFLHDNGSEYSLKYRLPSIAT